MVESGLEMDRLDVADDLVPLSGEPLESYAESWTSKKGYAVEVLEERLAVRFETRGCAQPCSFLGSDGGQQGRGRREELQLTYCRLLDALESHGGMVSIRRQEREERLIERMSVRVSQPPSEAGRTNLAGSSFLPLPCYHSLLVPTS